MRNSETEGQTKKSDKNLSKRAVYYFITLIILINELKKKKKKKKDFHKIKIKKLNKKCNLGVNV